MFSSVVGLCSRLAFVAAVEQCDLSTVRVHPRFSVEQGVREDGTKKIRAVDNFSWANAPGGPKKRKLESVNGHTALPEKLKHDHIDDLLAAVKLFMTCVGMLELFSPVLRACECAEGSAWDCPVCGRLISKTPFAECRCSRSIDGQR